MSIKRPSFLTETIESAPIPSQSENLLSVKIEKPEEQSQKENESAKDDFFSDQSDQACEDSDQLSSDDETS